MTDSSTQNSDRKLIRLIGIGFVSRFFVNTAAQLFNPFMTMIAAGLGVSVVTLGRLVSLRSAMGLFAPLFGSLADRYGHRRFLRLGALTASIGLLLLAVGGSVPLIALGMVIMGLGLGIFAPLFQAYLSAFLPYHRRARVLGIVEYSWALAGIIGLFVAGQLIEIFSWRAPFIVLGVGLLLAWLALGTFPRPEPPAPPDTTAPQASLLSRSVSFINLGRGAGSAWGAIMAHGFNFFAMVHILIIHGAWLAEEYGLEAGSLGTIALIAGLVDWSASILVSLISDRLGKRRSLLIGTGGAVIGYAVLPFLNQSLFLAVFSIVLPRFFFEFSVVSNIALLSEQVPSQRGKTLTLAMAVSLIGVTIANWTGPWAYVNYGVMGLGPVSMVAALCALAIVVLGVQETPPPPAPLN